MWICPDCTSDLGTNGNLKCHHCGWQGETIEGIRSYLSTHDRASPVMNAYVNNYKDICEEDITHGVMPERYLRNLAQKMSKYLGNTNGMRVLEIGAGKGFLVEEVAATGASCVVAVDIALGYLQRWRGEDRVVPVQGNAENLPFKEGFDLAIATDILEHVLNVGSFLYSLNRALVFGGRACIRVPLEENLLMYSHHLGPCPYELVHLRTFNRKLLRDTLKEVGFEVERMIPDGFWLDHPASVWTRTPILSRWHAKLVESIKKRLVDPVDVELWHPSLARLVMRPVEIVVIAKKVGAIGKSPEGRPVVVYEATGANAEAR